MTVSYENASGQLNSAGIKIKQDFFTLRSEQIHVLLDLAKVQGYKKPKNANGSKARYYYAALQRDYNKSHK